MATGVVSSSPGLLTVFRRCSSSATVLRTRSTQPLRRGGRLSGQMAMSWPNPVWLGVAAMLWPTSS